MASARKTGTNENISTYGGAGQGRDYTSLSVWEAATDNDLVTATQSEVLECYDDQASFDDGGVSLSGATTNSSYFRIIRPAGVKGQSSWQGHDGTPKNGVHFIDTTIEDIFEIDEDYAQIQDLIAEHNGNDNPGTRRCFKIDNGADPDQAAFIGCIGIGDGNAGASLITCFELQPDNSEGFVIDCIAIRATNKGYEFDAGLGTMRAYNCLAVDCDVEGFDQNDGTVIAKNCIAVGTITGVGFDGTYDAASDYNASDDATAPGTNSRQNQTFTFRDAAGDDYHLDKDDAGAKGFGTDLSSDTGYQFDDDIDWQVRSTWDIGPDNYTWGGGGNTPKVNNVGAINIGKINGVDVSDIGTVNGVE